LKQRIDHSKILKILWNGLIQRNFRENLRFNLLETSVCVSLFYSYVISKCSIGEFSVVLILIGLSTKYGRQSTERYTHDDRLISRGARNQEPDDNRYTRHKIYTGSSHQHDVKLYIMCFVILY
jgi:hypothetical protein